MKVVYLGTPEFAVAPLVEIAKSRHELIAVITQPDKPVGRKAIITPCAVKVAGLNLGAEVYSFNKISVDGISKLKELNPDVLVTCAYGQILSQEILDVAKFGVINIHASLLPKLRGASPIQHAIINGDKITGVTIMQTDIGVDTGDIIKSREIEIFDGETYGELSDRLSKLGASIIVECLDEIETGKAVKTPQNHQIATKTTLIKKEHAKIDFTKSAESIVNLIRGMNPSPVAFTFLDGKKLKVFKAKVSEYNGNAGEVLFADNKNGLIIGAGDKSVLIEELQLEGGKRLEAKVFLLGNKIEVGKIL